MKIFEFLEINNDDFSNSQICSKFLGEHKMTSILYFEAVKKIYKENQNFQTNQIFKKSFRPT